MTERITVDPLVCHGKPTEEILAEYEDLDREDILAALSYVARLMHVKRKDRLVA